MKPSTMVDAMAGLRDAGYGQTPASAQRRPSLAAGLTNWPMRRLQAIEEFERVLGMTPELYQRIAPLITIYSRQPGVYTQIATRVRGATAIPNVTDEQIDAYSSFK
jgi:general secretion pathway protein K